MKRTLLVAVAGLAVAGLGYIRLAPMDPVEWHVDPEAAQRTGNPNDYLVADGGDRPAARSDVLPGALMARLDEVALAEDGTERLAGSPEGGFVTYVQRSRIMGYPDAISVRAVPDGDGSRLTIYSRSRYGKSDMGVNEARVKRWLAALDLA